MATTCPTCGQETLKFFPRQDVFRCANEACGEQFSSARTIDALHPLVLRWPSVLALALHEYHGEEHPVLKLWHACDVVEMTLRFLVMIGVAEAARGGELPDPLARQLWERIERPMLGHWRGMAETLVKAQEAERTLMPEARAYLFDVLVPLLDGSSHPRTAETSFARLRNLLAHGAGVTKTMARRLLGVWQPRFEKAMAQGAWLGQLSLVVRDATGAFAELRGPTTKPAPLTAADSEALSAASITSDSILLVRGGRVLRLWPLAVYGEPRAADSRPTGLGDTAQVYVRRGEVRLEYTPLGSEAACEAVGDQTTLDAFQRIFRLDRYRSEALAKGFSVRGFERELRKDSDQLVGRSDETERLRRLLDEPAHGVIWVSGLAGVGKSFVVARVVSELIEAAADDRLVLPYRFRVGDAERCSRDAFVRFAVERLEAWLGAANECKEEERGGGKPLERLRGLIEKVPHERHVVFVLDGMDEVAQRDPDFAREVPLALRLRGVVWLCAGRPERGLPEAFRQGGALEPFPDGLPRMSAGDIRTMLLEKIGPLRRKLLKGDRDEGDRVVNPFIERVAKNAEGLPIYVKYVVGDVLQGKLSPEPGETRLPPSLAAYHEELLRRCSVGDLHQVLTPLAATLAVAKEPLTAEELTALLVRRTMLSGGEASRERVQQAVAAMAAMVDLSPDPDGGEGYKLWHESLREHMLNSPQMSEAITTARDAMAQAGLRPAGDGAQRYLLSLLEKKS